VDLARRYFEEGADEVTFLNITGFRDFPLGDMPMLEVLRKASEGVFVPLTVGGGIREFTDAQGKHYSALEVAAEYFRCTLPLLHCRAAAKCKLWCGAWPRCINKP
jgi:imidazole glycerol-phosphate synthase